MLRLTQQDGCLYQEEGDGYFFDSVSSETELIIDYLGSDGLVAYDDLFRLIECCKQTTISRFEVGCDGLHLMSKLKEHIQKIGRRTGPIHIGYLYGARTEYISNLSGCGVTFIDHLDIRECGRGDEGRVVELITESGISVGHLSLRTPFDDFSLAKTQINHIGTLQYSYEYRVRRDYSGFFDDIIENNVTVDVAEDFCFDVRYERFLKHAKLCYVLKHLYSTKQKKEDVDELHLESTGR